MTGVPSFRLADHLLYWTKPEKCGLGGECGNCGSRTVRHPAIHECTDLNHACNVKGWSTVPNNADVSNKGSLEIAKGMLDFLGVQKIQDWQARQTAATFFEAAVRSYITLDDLVVRRGSRLSEFAQYRHLAGRHDDDLRLDITVSNSNTKLLAVLELKTTVRSDRARGAIRNLTGALHQHQGRDIPIAAVVTAEPLPSRLLSITPQTGDTHLVFHVALRALTRVVTLPGEPDRDGWIARPVLSKRSLAQWEKSRIYLRDFSELTPLLQKMS